MPDDRDPKQGSWVIWAGVSFALMLILYPLSLGPVIWLAGHDLLPGWLLESLEYFYLPVLWLSQTSEWCEAALEWYVDLWDALPEPSPSA